MSNRKHLAYMAVAAAVVLAGMWLVGVPIDRALPWAVLLACPAMMIVMMLFMHDAASQTPQQHQEPNELDAGDLRHVDEQYRR